MCSPIQHGGLRVRKLRTFNQAVLGTWSRKHVGSAHGCSLWRRIRGGWERFPNYVQFQAKNGDCVKFLHAFCGAEESLFGRDVPEFLCNSS